MLLTCLLLALSVSIDSFGIGITYGLRDTKISIISKILLFFISIFFTSISIIFGNFLINVLPRNYIKLIGSILLFCIGMWIIYQTLKKEKNIPSNISNKEPKIYSFFIKFLGITIKIIRNPISSDLDNSKTIDWKEAIFLGVALSIDSIGVGIGSSIIGVNSFLFSILVASFQLIFLSLGKNISMKIIKLSKLPENIWSIISGILLIIIAISKYFL